MKIRITLNRITILFTPTDQDQLTEIRSLVSKEADNYEKIDWYQIKKHPTFTHMLVFSCDIFRPLLQSTRLRIRNALLKHTNDNIKVFTHVMRALDISTAYNAAQKLFLMAADTSTQADPDPDSEFRVALKYLSELRKRDARKRPITQDAFAVFLELMASKFASEKKFKYERFFLETCISNYLTEENKDDPMFNWLLSELYNRLYICCLRGKLADISKLTEFNNKSMTYLVKCKPSSELPQASIDLRKKECIEVGRMLKAGDLTDRFISASLNIEILINTGDVLIIKETVATTGIDDYIKVRFTNELIRLITDKTPANLAKNAAICDALVEGAISSGDSQKIADLLQPQYRRGVQEQSQLRSKGIIIPKETSLLIKKLRTILDKFERAHKIDKKTRLAPVQMDFSGETDNEKVKLIPKKNDCTEDKLDVGSTEKVASITHAASTPQDADFNLSDFSMLTIENLLSEIKKHIRELIIKDKAAKKIVTNLKNEGHSINERLWRKYCTHQPNLDENLDAKDDDIATIAAQTYEKLLLNIEERICIQLNTLRTQYNQLTTKFDQKIYTAYKADRLEMINQLSIHARKLETQLNNLDEMLQHPPKPVIAQKPSDQKLIAKKELIDSTSTTTQRATTTTSAEEQLKAEISYNDTIRGTNGTAFKTLLSHTLSIKESEEKQLAAGPKVQVAFKGYMASEDDILKEMEAALCDSQLPDFLAFLNDDNTASHTESNHEKTNIAEALGASLKNGVLAPAKQAEPKTTTYTSLPFLHLDSTQQRPGRN